MNRRHFIVGVFCGLLIGFGLIVLSACSEPETTSPFTGKRVSANALGIEAQQEVAKAQAEEKEKQDKAQADIDAATRKAKLAMTKLNADQQVQAAQVQDELDTVVAASTLLSNQAADIAKTRLADIDTAKNQGLAQIEKNRQATLAAWSFAKPFVTLIPGYGQQIADVGDKAVNAWAGLGTLGAVAGAVGTVVQTIGKRRATAKGKAVINHLDTMRAMSPDVKNAMANAMKDPVIKAAVQKQLDQVSGAKDFIKNESVT